MFYLLLQNFVNIKAIRMKFVTIIAQSLSYTLMVNLVTYLLLSLHGKNWTKILDNGNEKMILK